MKVKNILTNCLSIYLFILRLKAIDKLPITYVFFIAPITTGALSYVSYIIIYIFTFRLCLGFK